MSDCGNDCNMVGRYGNTAGALATEFVSVLLGAVRSPSLGAIPVWQVSDEVLEPPAHNQDSSCGKQSKFRRNFKFAGKLPVVLHYSDARRVYFAFY